MIALSAAAAFTTSASADASAVRLVWTQQFTGPNAAADCRVTGDAGRGGRWDFYHCDPAGSSIYLHGYIIVS
ncbi:MAG: hypothetical protein ACJ72N_24465 [Labedaea sp.]